MTTTGIKLLNEVQKLLIAFANEKGISLQDEFGTVEEFKRFVIAFTIRSLTELGIEMSKAYDIVMGDGAYEKLANEVWAACQ